MRRIRWARLAFAGVTMVLGAAVAPYALLAATQPVPEPQLRRTPGPSDCATGERLEEAAARHAEQGGDDEARAAQVAEAVRSATRCRSLEEVDWRHQFAVFQAVAGTVTWTAARPDPGALEELLALWELASDQRRVGSIVNAFTWFGVELLVASEVETLLPRAVGREAQVRDRLLGLAAAELDWSEVARRDEAVAWDGALRAELWNHPTPFRWFEMLDLIWSVRNQTSDILADARDDERAVRTAAAVLAATTETFECPEPADVQALAPLGLDLTWFPDQCAVLGRAGRHTFLGVGTRCVVVSPTP